MAIIAASPTVDRFLAAVAEGRVTEDLYTPDALLDATVPGWRFQLTGGAAIAGEYARWFNAPCRFESIERHSIDRGEVVRYLQVLDLPEPVTAHHIHVLRVEGNRIAADTVICGGRWGPEAVAAMGPVSHA